MPMVLPTFTSPTKNEPNVLGRTSSPGRQTEPPAASQFQKTLSKVSQPSPLARPPLHADAKLAKPLKRDAPGKAHPAPSRDRPAKAGAADDSTQRSDKRADRADEQPPVNVASSPAADQSLPPPDSDAITTNDQPSALPSAISSEMSAQQSASSAQSLPGNGSNESLSMTTGQLCSAMQPGQIASLRPVPEKRPQQASKEGDSLQSGGPPATAPIPFDAAAISPQGAAPNGAAEIAGSGLPSQDVSQASAAAVAIPQAQSEQSSPTVSQSSQRGS